MRADHLCTYPVSREKGRGPLKPGSRGTAFVVIDGVAAANKERRRRSCGSSRSSDRRGGAVAIAKTGRSGRNASGKFPTS
jgi:hypothetical protein